MNNYLLISLVLVRVLLDFLSVYKPHVAIDVAYIGFLLIVGCIAIASKESTSLGLVIVAVAFAWSFIIYLRKTGAIKSSVDAQTEEHDKGKSD